MIKLSTFKTALLSAALLALPAAHAAPLSKTEFTAGMSRIQADYKTEREACNTQAKNAKDICVQEAKAHEKVERATLAHAYSEKPDDLRKVQIAKAESRYAVAKERCDDAAGQAKDVCRKEAKAIETKSLAGIKLGEKMADARQDAAQTRRDADHSVAAEKCESLDGDAQRSCKAKAAVAAEPTNLPAKR